MGKSSDTDSGLLPCYFQKPTSIFIDWSVKSFSAMNAEKHSDLANKEFRFLQFKNQISFSTTGQYAPTFRIPSGLIFLNKASRIFLRVGFEQLEWLGIFNSKLFKYFSKNFSNHSVEFGVQDLKQLLFLGSCSGIKEKVESILDNQKIDLNYDHASHEQIEIDRLVYEAYGLNAEDIAEVENWYARRYPKLSQAQKANLRKLNPHYLNTD